MKKEEENEKVTMVIIFHDKVDENGNLRIRETYLPEGNIFPKNPPLATKITIITSCGNTFNLSLYRAEDLVEAANGKDDNPANGAILRILKTLNPDTFVGIR